MVGWQLYNLGDYRAAQYYYDDARTAAHDAENTELVTYVLCTMSRQRFLADRSPEVHEEARVAQVCGLRLRANQNLAAAFRS
ncbi:hypothetical protein ABZ467_35355 [Streptomyces sp. NPDC005727]|uniref:hypothetical protein n=1 Tax=Streptomyces sp. NPDC005727 TaxID=3157053 RepID=UPI00340065B5